MSHLKIQNILKEVMKVMAQYQKPVVISPGYSPEPVEAGCCLTSCGGSPGGMQAGRHLNRQAEASSKILKRVCSKIKS